MLVSYKNDYTWFILVSKSIYSGPLKSLRDGLILYS